ncbi:EAL domain-containing protein [Salinicola avicenniae]|uniref:EAL domain-containing protein n=1 Tax=Salinicola avicenniae TaxID=2916836 RepID=UPI002072FF2E|nr:MULTISPECIES: EAL domain-containing protein [unclassified Salinicola]
MSEQPPPTGPAREARLLADIEALREQLVQAASAGACQLQTGSDEPALHELVGVSNTLLQDLQHRIDEHKASCEALEKRLEARTERLDLVLTATHDGVWEWFISSGEIELSQRWSNMLGLPHAGSRQPLDHWLSRIHDDDRDQVERALYQHLDGLEGAVNVEYRIRDARGAWRMMLCRGLCQRDEGGEPVCMAGTQTDITEHRLRDPLTGLPNGTYLELLLQERLGRRPLMPMALVKLQLLNVASLFDGVAVEDAIAALRRLVQRMRRQLPPRITLIALPEHTFAMIFDTDSAEALETALQPLEAVLAEPVDIDGQQVWLSHVSGVAALRRDKAVSVDEWRHQSRLALAAARAADVGSRRHYSDGLRHWERQNSRAEQRIRAALAGDGVRCFLQPIVDAGTGEIDGFEALMRLYDPCEGIMSPGSFIEIAERSGLISPLWEMLMEQALPVLKDPAMRDAYGESFLLSINLSTRQLLDPCLLDTLIAASRRHGVSFQRLQVEVTETSVLSDPVKAFRILDRIRAAGIGVALDDFGSGYSSLAQLTSLPMDTVKIDRELVRNVTTLPRKRHVLAAVIELCQRLDYRVVVEGVEDRLTLEMLCDLGVSDIQGFYYSRPLPLERLLSDFRRPQPFPQPHLAGN